LLAAFPGDHVGEPRLLICLYGPPLLHVDLKFMSTDEFLHRVEDPMVLWDRAGALRAALLALLHAGAQPNGVRRVEQKAATRVPAFRTTLSLHDPTSFRAARNFLAGADGHGGAS